MNESGPTLRDIHLPADPSWWPPAPGWWILALLVIALTLFAAWWLRRRLRAQRWKRRVMSEFSVIAARYATQPDSPRLAAEVSQLLRRASRLLDPKAATLRGEAWLSFLDSKLGGDNFSNGVGRAILQGPYQREATFDTDALLALSKIWLMRALAERGRHV